MHQLKWRSTTDPAMYVAAKKITYCFGKKTNNETLSNTSLEFQLVWYR